VLAQGWVDVALSGAATVATLRSNLAALEVTWDAELDERLAVLAEPADEYWERRSRLPWN
jgi:aryl-alcohol dehydrogenase-like predicted oxidoreductase